MGKHTLTKSRGVLRRWWDDHVFHFKTGCWPGACWLTGQWDSNCHHAQEADEEMWGEWFEIPHRAEPEFGIQLPGPHRMRVHRRGDCKGEHCCIHNPSDHPLKDAPMNWRGDRALMERICDHGIGHPDPDDIEFKRLTRGDVVADAESVHGCDGCCH